MSSSGKPDETNLLLWRLFHDKTCSDSERCSSCQKNPCQDFDHFVNRHDGTFWATVGPNNKADKIWTSMMFFVHGEKWKNIRLTFSPIFTSGKMKAMLIFMQETCTQLIGGIDKCAETNEAFELKDTYYVPTLEKYSMDTIASSAFGVDAVFL